MPITHVFVSQKQDVADDSLVRPSDWNENHAVVLDVEKKTSDYTVTTSDELILVDSTTGNVTITLPALADFNKKTVRIKKITGGGIVTIQPSGSETIDDNSALCLIENYGVVSLFADSNNSNWWIL